MFLGELRKGNLPIASIPKTFIKIPADIIAASDAVPDKITMIGILVYTSPTTTFRQMRSKSPNYTAGAVLVNESSGIMHISFPLWKVWIFEVIPYVSKITPPVTETGEPVPVPVLTSPVTAAPSVPSTIPMITPVPANGSLLLLPAAQAGILGISAVNWMLIAGGATGIYLIMNKQKRK